MGGLVQVAVSVNKTNTLTVNIPAAQDEAARVVNLLADEIRNAQICTASVGCVANSAIGMATAKEITFYRDSTGAARRYRQENGELRRFTGTSTTPDRVIPNVTNLDLKYFLSTSYNAASHGTPESWGGLVTGSTLAQIAAVRIEATVRVGGQNATYSTVVRLRNSPKKS
jgi:hypothetical protein